MTNLSLVVILAFISVVPRQTPPPERTAKLTYKVIEVQGGYGYDIYADGKILIHQPGISGQPGTAVFRKRSDSEKVAELVIKKLNSKKTPPSITTEELRQLRVID